MTERLRDCEPAPHDLVHVLHAPKADTLQCSGQGPWLHACVSAVCGHAAPPFCGWTCVRVRCCEPAPHDVVHVDQAPNVPSTQFVGQSCELQLRYPMLNEHALPPEVGAVIERARDCTPKPQDLLQELNAPQTPCTQSVAHAAVLQLRVSARYGHT